MILGELQYDDGVLLLVDGCAEIGMLQTETGEWMVTATIPGMPAYESTFYQTETHAAREFLRLAKEMGES